VTAIPAFGRSANRCATLLRAAVALCFICPLSALNPTLTIRQLDHLQRLDDEERILVGQVSAIAQTPDGYLWLGSNRGLFRFDGLRLTTFSSELNGASNIPIHALYAGNGALWIGTSAGLSVLQGANIKLLADPAGKPLGSIVRILADSEGTVWAARASGGLLRVRRAGSHDFNVQPVSIGRQASLIRALFLDSHGQFWIGTQSGACQWNGQTAAPCFAADLQVISLSEDEQNHLLIGTSKGVLRVENGRASPFAMHAGKIAILPALLLRDRDHAVWIGTLGQGLLRCLRGQIEAFSRRDGLSSDLIESLFEDRNGNLWAGTADGLNQFRNPQFPRYTTLEGLSGELISAVEASRTGALWIGTVGSGVNRIERNEIRPLHPDSGLPSPTITSLYEDSDGRMWVGTTAGLAYWAGTRFVQVKSVDGSPIKNVFSIAESGGSLWLAAGNNRLARIERNKLMAVDVALPAMLGGIYRITAGSRGGIWVGLYKGGVAYFDGIKAEFYGPAEGIANGPVLALREDSVGSLWIGTTTGLTRLNNGRSKTWMMEGGVQGIVDDGKNGWWLATPTSLLHFRPASIGSRFQGPAIPFDPNSANDRLWLGDGLCATTPRIALAGDGRLWLGTDDGLLAFDTVHIEHDMPLPNPLIQQVIVDGKALILRQSSTPVFRGTEVQIRYTGVNLTSPEQVEFRYRLQGFQSSWTEVGARRQAVYTNLQQGSYTFCVMARNHGSAWGSYEARQSFRIQPPFYQSRLFAGACVAVLTALLTLAYRIRIRRLRMRFALVLEERARIARELHDTLLQGFAGVTYQIAAVYHQLKSRPEASFDKLPGIMDLADQSMAEARQAISLLRLSGLQGKTLAEAISSAGQELTANTGTHFSSTERGMSRNLAYDVEASLYMAACEAIRNATKHAHPTKISADLSLTIRGLRLAIVDDGNGFDPEIAQNKAGHFGINGMQERVRSIGGTFSILTAPGKGACVEILVPRYRLLLRRLSDGHARPKR
jgi:signal transduction histidine kinase/ligand-binding sensor domain-containing protein